MKYTQGGIHKEYKMWYKDLDKHMNLKIYLEQLVISIASLIVRLI